MHHMSSYYLLLGCEYFVFFTEGSGIEYKRWNYTLGTCGNLETSGVEPMISYLWHNGLSNKRYTGAIENRHGFPVLWEVWKKGIQ